MELREYGVGALFTYSLLDAEGSPAGLVLESGLTLAADDVQLATNKQSMSTLTAEYAAFTSGSVEPRVGATLSGATSSETAVVIGFILSSGTWGGGDAAGTIFVEQVSGVFTATENLDNDDTSDTNVMTLTADFTGGIGAAMVGRVLGVALTASEMSCKWGHVDITDETATEVFLETWAKFQTYGHPDAMHPTAGDATHLLSTTIDVVTSQTDLQLAQGLVDADAANSMMVVIRDATVTNQKSVRTGDDYIVANNNLILRTAPDFTVAAGDVVDIYAVSPILAEVLTDTGTTIPGTITTAQNDLDTITGSDGVTLATAQANYAPAKAGDEMGLANDAITAAKIAADAIGASELAADAVTEIVAGVFARTYDATDMSGVTFEELTALIGCALLAKVSGMDTTTATFRNLADGANPIVATVDADGNRSAVTLTLTAVR